MSGWSARPRASKRVARSDTSPAAAALCLGGVRVRVGVRVSDTSPAAAALCLGGKTSNDLTRHTPHTTRRASHGVSHGHLTAYLTAYLTGIARPPPAQRR
eukprot:scaffold43281_cov56-Phaeocystis_antarctica.AAC.2